VLVWVSLAPVPAGGSTAQNSRSTLHRAPALTRQCSSARGNALSDRNKPATYVREELAVVADKLALYGKPLLARDKVVAQHARRHHLHVRSINNADDSGQVGLELE